MLRQNVSIGPFGGQGRLSSRLLHQSDPYRIVHHIRDDPRSGQIQLKLRQVLQNRNTRIGGDGVSYLRFGERPSSVRVGVVGSPLVMRRYLRETEMANLNPLVGTTQMVVEFTYGDEVVRYVYEPIKIMPIKRDCDIERDAW